MLKNLFAAFPMDLGQEQIETILRASQIRIQRIVSKGHASPDGFWYDQDQHEWVVVLKGAARLRFEGEEPIELNAGDYLSIPAHRRHRVEWTCPDDETVWLAVHYGQPIA